jgi:hypothetical protein
VPPFFSVGLLARAFWLRSITIGALGRRAHSGYESDDRLHADTWVRATPVIRIEREVTGATSAIGPGDGNFGHTGVNARESRASFGPWRQPTHCTLGPHADPAPRTAGVLSSLWRSCCGGAHKASPSGVP